MNKKKLGTVIMAIALAVSIGTTAWASTSTDSDTTSTGRQGPPPMGGSQNSEMRTKIKEQQEKWDALTDDQKATVYSLEEQIADLHKQVIEQYSQYGLIDSDKATEMEEQIANSLAQMKENGTMPNIQMMGGGFGGPGGHGGPGGPGGSNTNSTGSTDTSGTDSAGAETSGT